jgi:hypothetical protein
MVGLYQGFKSSYSERELNLDFSLTVQELQFIGQFNGESNVRFPKSLLEVPEVSHSNKSSYARSSQPPSSEGANLRLCHSRERLSQNSVAEVEQQPRLRRNVPADCAADRGTLLYSA